MEEKYSYFHVIEIPHSDDKDIWVLKADRKGKLEIMIGKGILNSEGKSNQGFVYELNKDKKTKIQITIIDPIKIPFASLNIAEIGFVILTSCILNRFTNTNHQSNNSCNRY